MAIKILEISRIKLSWAWYDLWVGFFIDKEKKILYFCPLPTILISVWFGRRLSIALTDGIIIGESQRYKLKDNNGLKAKFKDQIEPSGDPKFKKGIRHIYNKEKIDNKWVQNQKIIDLSNNEVIHEEKNKILK